MLCVYIHKNVYIHPIIRVHIYIYTQREREILYVQRKSKKDESSETHDKIDTHQGLILVEAVSRAGETSRPVHQGSTVTNLHITLGPYCEKVQLFGCFLPTFHGKTS